MVLPTCCWSRRSQLGKGEYHLKVVSNDIG